MLTATTEAMGWINQGPSRWRKEGRRLRTSVRIYRVPGTVPEAFPEPHLGPPLPPACPALGQHTVLISTEVTLFDIILSCGSPWKKGKAVPG